MKIKSKFKDYYDHVAYLYDGGDPKCVYIRERITDEISSKVSLTQKGLIDLPLSLTSNNKLDSNLVINFKWLSICGKYHLLISKSYGNWDLFTEEKYPIESKRISGYWSNWNRNKNQLMAFSDSLLELSRKLNAPVFTFHKPFRNSDTVIIDANIPILGDIGLPNLINSYQLYQEISYFMGNLINVSPDLSLKSMMTSKEKIVQHGFDIKKSFRHRK